MAVNPTVAALRKRSLGASGEASAIELLGGPDSLAWSPTLDSSMSLPDAKEGLRMRLPELPQEIQQDQLPELLRSHGIGISDKEVLEIIDVLRSEGVLGGDAGSPPGHLSSADIQAVISHISSRERGLSSVTITEPVTPPPPLQLQRDTRAIYRVISTLRAWWARARRGLRGDSGQTGTEVYESAVKPSNRLLLTVVAISLLIALSVGGLAVGLNWTSSMAARKAELAQQMKSIQGAADFFSLSMAQLETKKGLETSAAIIAKFLGQVGYGLDSTTTTASFLSAVQSSGTIVDTLFLQSNQLTMAHTAGTLATMLDHLWASGLN
eukprot:RCo017917